MAEEITATPGGEQAAPARASGGQWLAVFALLVALMAVCGIAYLYYSLVMHNPAAGIAERLAALQTAQSGLGRDLERLAGERQAAFEAFRAEIAERQRASEQALAESLGGLTVPDFPPERDWKLAEVEFLLRTANHRAVSERDADSALELLRAADGILGGLGGPAAHGVRATIASEILTLKQADAVDPAAVYLRLDAIKRRLTHLTLALPEYTSPSASSASSASPASPASPASTPAPASTSASAPEGEAAAPPAEGAGDRVSDTGVVPETGPEPAEPSPASEQRLPHADAGASPGELTPDAEPGFFTMVGRELGRLVRFRRFDTALERPAAPTESDLLEVNLRLMLEQAQLAALKRDQAVYAASLDAALDWARALLDGRDTGVRETIDSLEALGRLDLDAPLPDISGSLNELRGARRQQP